MTVKVAASPRLTYQVALVTGASGGIGTALVSALLSEGATVVAACRSPRHLVKLAESADGRLRLATADMTDLAGLASLVHRVESDCGRLDLLIPNAGVAQVRSLESVSLADWQHSIEVNLTAPFLLAQAAAAGMRERGFGRVLCMSSVAAYTGGFVGPHYAAAKSGLHGLVHYLSSRLAGCGVTANAIAPALIDRTDMTENLPEGVPSIPVGRYGRPAEVADLAMAVLANGYLTGQVLLMDGGLHPT
jgi:3-oxoacyl-[acyl-carrier protein] reductase